VADGITNAAIGVTVLTVVIMIFSWRYDWLLHPLTDSLRYANIYLHALLVNLPRGAVTNAAFGFIYKLCRYDVLPTDEIYDEYLFFGKHKALSPRFEEIGYESQYVVYNLGS
jgi:hypothetical protein